MSNVNQPVSAYRWIILTVYAIIAAVIQIQWLTFAPVAREARVFYDASALQIDFLSLIFMLVFILVCIPASFIIDTYGLKIGVGIGAVLTAVFGLMKGLFADSYTMVVIAQVGLAIAQPFIINAATKVAGVWFPIRERATAVGIATLAQFLGIVLVMILTPSMVVETADGSFTIYSMLMTYGIITVIGAGLLLVFLKEKPANPPEPNEQVERIQVMAGFRHIFRQRDMRLLLIMFFIGLGIFNAISTVIDQICEVKGLTADQTGLVGGIMLIAGIIGAIVLPPLSDKYRKRKLFLILAMGGMTPGLIGLTVFTGYIPLLVSSFILGFFLLGAGAPVGFQYAAEVTHPAPESTSQGLLLLAGQISGILFIVGMNLIGMIPGLVTFVALALVIIFLTIRLDESPMIGR
ncbi:MAG: MFS transporter [Candidatus Marinimicrobia bacterium]|nr:MFS transporter [Candidatus Neomarinimicrobiota bacterium]